jgi:hypothetical protein
MSFRQSKSTRHCEGRSWREWLVRNEKLLRACGLPPELTLSRAHWEDFLENQYLEHYPESNAGFMFDDLSQEQMGRLLALLESCPEYVGRAMVSWLRVRLGRAAAG